MKKGLLALGLAGALLAGCGGGGGEISEPYSHPEFGVPSVYLSRLGSLNVGRSFEVEVRGSYAYVSTLDGLAVVDVSNPSAPHEVARVESGNTVRDVEFYGNTAYVATNGGLAVYDMSSPSSPVFLYRTPSPAPEVVDVEVKLSTGGVFGTYNAGDGGYVALFSSDGQILQSVRVSPATVGGFYINEDKNIAIVRTEEGYSIVDLSSWSVLNNIYFYSSLDSIGDAYTDFLGHTGGMSVYSVSSNPYFPEEVGYINLYEHVEDIEFLGLNYLAVANWTNGVRIIDVSDPSRPKVAGEGSTTLARGVFVDRGTRRIYVADYNDGLVIFSYSF